MKGKEEGERGREKEIEGGTRQGEFRKEAVTGVGGGWEHGRERDT